jgi:citrate synthase|tara:strand:- start:795 stop:1925 length:1131 start_codon:yes stop_codon:yes gene_type:complete
MMTESTATSAGLKGVVAGRSSICLIDGEQGLLAYRGYDIHDLAKHSTFEETTYLLWEGKLPTRADLADFTTMLAEQRSVPESVLDLIVNSPIDAPPMATLRTAVSALGAADPLGEDMSPKANRTKAARLTAQIATLTAAIERCRHRLEPISPDPALNHAANFLYMVRGERASTAASRAFDVALVMHADHGFNASTFSSRVTAATLSDMHSAITSAIGTLKGPLHGGANQRVKEMLDEIGSPDCVVDYVDKTLAAKKRIMGFGHRVYRVEDPRGRHLKAHAEKLQDEGDPMMLETSARLIEVMHQRKGLSINVDFYSASLYTYLRLPPDLFPNLFAISRIAGWAAHILEQYADNQLIRPRSEYRGPGQRRYRPLGER